MKYPPFIEKGSKIGIVSTARKISKIEINPCIEVIQKMGYIPVLGDNLFEENNHTSQRLSDFQSMIDNDNIQAILCARGGYGTVQIIDLIDFSKFLKKPKWIAGYSDVTVLHSHINCALQISTIHSTMPINFPSDGSINKSVASLFETLSGIKNNYSFSNHPLNIDGEIQGEIIGGNLSILYSLTGTKSLTSLDNKILFIEDLDEYLYHIDRMMMNLKRAGLFNKIRGVLVGGMSDMNDNTVPFGKTAEQIIYDHIKDFNIPLAFNFPAGHIKENYAFILGSEIKISINRNAETSFVTL